MTIYKLAVQEKLRFSTPKGTVTTEDLFDLPLSDVDTVAMEIKRKLETSVEGSFLKPKPANTILKLQLNILVDVIETRLLAIQKSKAAEENKAKKQKIMEIIESKQDDKLKDSSIKELKKQLKGL